jgi:hypothetical protein
VGRIAPSDDVGADRHAVRLHKLPLDLGCSRQAGESYALLTRAPPEGGHDPVENWMRAEHELVGA